MRLFRGPAVSQKSGIITLNPEPPSLTPDASAPQGLNPYLDASALDSNEIRTAHISCVGFYSRLLKDDYS